MTDEVFIPEIAQQMINLLTRDTGVAPTVRKYVSGYLLEHENEHVYMTIRYKRRSRKWAQVRSTLSIDGVRQAILARDYADYVKIFTTGVRTSLEDGAELAEIPELSEPLPDDQIPDHIRSHMIRTNAALDKEQRKGMAVSVHTTRDRHVLKFDAGRLIVYSFYQHGEFGWEDTEFMVVSENGYDFTDRFLELNGDIQALLKEMGENVPSTNIPGQIRRSAEPSRLNSVEVRRASVMRV